MTAALNPSAAELDQLLGMVARYAFQSRLVGAATTMGERLRLQRDAQETFDEIANVIRELWAAAGRGPT